MPYKTSFFRKTLILVLLILLSVIAVYSYSYQVSVNVVERELKNTSMRQMLFFLSQVESNATRLLNNSVILSLEPDIRGIIYLDGQRSYVENLLAKKNIEDKLILYRISSAWSNDIAIYSPVSKVGLSTYSVLEYKMSYPNQATALHWDYIPKSASNATNRFVWYTIDQAMPINNSDAARLVVEVSFYPENLVGMLDQFTTDMQGNPFFFSPDYPAITNRTGDSALIGELNRYLHDSSLTKDSDQMLIGLSGKEYMVSYVYSDILGWYLVDFMPMEDVLRPINKNKDIFWVIILALLVAGVGILSVVYRGVQIPIRELVHNVKMLKNGNYSVRLKGKPSNEFHYLYEQFNEMTEQIQNLIENVHAEKIRSREATVKQLQSQINPHFFYNCLTFIVSMARLGRNKAVENMAINLADYYRYTTRVENQNTTLGDELSLIHNYLAIQKLRREIDYEINVPEEMLKLPLPRLIIQPLVENSIIHGIEPMIGTGKIVISGQIDEGTARLAVEDNGVGLTQEKLHELRNKCVEPLTGEMGCGVWNVHQRLTYLYGSESGLFLDHSDLGGLKAVITWSAAGHG